jgi:hypothetical protein
MTPWQRAEIICALEVKFGPYESGELVVAVNEIFNSHERLTSELSEALAAVKFWRGKHDELRVSKALTLPLPDGWRAVPCRDDGYHGQQGFNVEYCGGDINGDLNSIHYRICDGSVTAYGRIPPDAFRHFALLNGIFHEDDPTAGNELGNRLCDKVRECEALRKERDDLLDKLEPDCCVCGCQLLPPETPTDGYHCIDCVPDTEK